MNSSETHNSFSHTTKTSITKIIIIIKFKDDSFVEKTGDSEIKEDGKIEILEVSFKEGDKDINNDDSDDIINNKFIIIIINGKENIFFKEEIEESESERNDNNVRDDRIIIINFKIEVRGGNNDKDKFWGESGKFGE
jgi:hypothetical protein